MITAKGLTKKFGKVDALRGVDLSVSRGEMFALIGPDGAGKTTFFRIVSGLLAPTSGTLVRDPGVPFGLVPQRFSLYEDLTVDENLELRAKLYSVPPAEAAKRAADLLGRVGMDRFRKRLAGALSGGMKQKLALVSALLTRPDLLLLDEPTTGVDPVSRRDFWRILHQFLGAGMTIVVSTPYMDEAEYAERIGFLDCGKLSAVGSRQEILASYSRPLLEIRTENRLAVKDKLRSLPEVDDVSLFGTRLHVRGKSTTGDSLESEIQKALSGLVRADEVRRVSPSLEDVFVLAGEEEGPAA